MSKCAASGGDLWMKMAHHGAAQGVESRFFRDFCGAFLSVRSSLIQGTGIFFLPRFSDLGFSSRENESDSSDCESASSSLRLRVS